MKKSILSLLFYLLVALGISLTIKADIGVSSFNALNIAVSAITHIEVGTITGLINFLFLVISYFFDTKKNIKEYTLIIISLFFLGFAINFFVYDILRIVEFNNYFIRILIFVIGTTMAGIGTGRILHFGVLKFPIEKYCQLMEATFQRPFSFYRYGVDVSCVAISLIISGLFNLSFYVREGTVISLFFLSYIIGISKNWK